MRSGTGKWLALANGRLSLLNHDKRAIQRHLALQLLEPRQLLAGDLLYIGDGGNDSIRVFDADTGAYVAAFVDSGGAGLRGPRGMVIQGNDLLVVNQNVHTSSNGEIVRFDLRDSTQFSHLVASTSMSAPFAPHGILLKDNELFVADALDDGVSADGRIAKYDAITGEYIEDLATSSFNGEFRPRGIVFGPDGGLYVSVASVELSGSADPPGHIVRYDFEEEENKLQVIAWNDGDGIQESNQGEAIGLHNPGGLVFGPDGKLYVISNRINTDTSIDENTRIVIIDPNSGRQVREIELGANDSIKNPTRTFAQAMVFGPNGKLFIPVAVGSLRDGSVLGGIFVYDPPSNTVSSLVTPSFYEPYLVFPWYATFGKTDPATLAYQTDSEPAPQSRVADLAYYSSQQFDVHWDVEPGQVGNFTFDIHVSANGGPYEIWLQETTEHDARFAGQNGVEYRFFSVAHDGRGNVESVPVSPDASTIARAFPWQNPINRFDVIGTGGRVTASHALRIINYLAIVGPNYQLPEPSANLQPGNGGVFWDVSGNGFVSALDALDVINEMARQSLNEGSDGGEDIVAFAVLNNSEPQDFSFSSWRSTDLFSVSTDRELVVDQTFVEAAGDPTRTLWINGDVDSEDRPSRQLVDDEPTSSIAQVVDWALSLPILGI